MKDSDFIDLANRVIDGVGTEHDRAALDAVLHDSMHRRLEYNQLSAVASILDAVRPVDPPPGLRDRILASIPRSAPSVAVAAGPNIWDRITDFLGVRPGIALAYAVVTGLVIGALGVGIFSGGLGADESTVAGTMGQAGEFALVDEASTSIGSSRIDGQLRASSVGFTIALDVRSDSPADIGILPVQGLASWQVVVLPEQTDVEVRVEQSGIWLASVSDGRIEVTGLRSGELQFNVTFASGAEEDVLVLRSPN